MLSVSAGSSFLEESKNLNREGNYFRGSGSLSPFSVAQCFLVWAEQVLGAPTFAGREFQSFLRNLNL
jgi:hypothetical protein